ncbi:hemolysin family protein [Flavobacteriaceae bacterium]|jgi:CBS domain containing-hemolysin-like protein|nr:hemolysin family protein [bacterium]MDA9341595.1 hemolysin family protein [Flavobacteriaceae bacterium]MDB9993556.1 hemolysin family protein [Flavobacteriaceae bacterium]
MDYSIIMILSMLVLSAFFSGMEIAYVSSNKVHIAIEKQQDGFLSKILQKITNRPSKFIATMLIGNNIALVIYGFFMGDLLMSYIGPYLGIDSQNTSSSSDSIMFLALFIQTIISTFVILITAEFLPKVFFQIYANNLVKFFALPVYFFYIVFSVVSEFIIWITDKILKFIFKTDGDEVQLSFSKVELGNYISEQMETVKREDEVDSEIQIFQNALDFSEVKSREVLIPRTEVVAVTIDKSPKELSELFIKTGLSKILVYNENIDNILGYVHSFELFKKPTTIKSILIPVVFVPETMLIKEVLNILTKKSKSIAVVIDEYGGTSGILTVEDIIEELFGEIEDEHDKLVLIEKVVNNGTYVFSARLDVDYLNETYKLNLPENENYETLGGMIVSFTEGIPKKDEVIVFQDYTFNILEVSDTKVELVEVKYTPVD